MRLVSIHNIKTESVVVNGMNVLMARPVMYLTGSQLHLVKKRQIRLSIHPTYVQNVP
jgi:hypothetical protein